MIRLSLVPVLACLVAALALPGCESLSQFGTLGDALNALDGEWILDQFEGADVASMLPEGARVPSLAIADDGSVSGFAGVNQLTSQLDLDTLMSGKFDLGSIATTRMAGTSEAMDLETSVLGALEQVTGFRLDGDALSLLDGGDELLRYIRP